MTPGWMVACHAGAVLARVERRLIDGGAVLELGQFGRLSADEIDCLLRQERESTGVGHSDPHPVAGTVAA